MTKRKPTANRRLAKKRVQCINEALCFVSSSVLADSLVPRNPLLRQAPKRYMQYDFQYLRRTLRSYFFARKLIKIVIEKSCVIMEN